jgi:hypothetical protein
VTERFRFVTLAGGALAVTALAVVATLAMCTGPDRSSEQQVLGQYRKLWTETMPAATRTSGTARRDMLGAVLTEPALSHAVRSFAALEKRGRVPYGRDVPLRQSVELSGERAVVSGCLDSSRSGVADKRTGRKLNRGVATNPVTVTFTRGSDGVWRASRTEFPGTKRC